jgi:UDP-N-acetylglucosamine--dolichyl-phosphate N-acetylglucosaminephosphotransferase
MAYHTYLTVLVPAIISFIVTLIVTLFLMPYLKGAGVTAIDHNKKRSRVLPCSVGLAVAFGFAVGILAYSFGASFSLYQPVATLQYLFATVMAVTLISFTGFLDDINVKGTLVSSTDMLDTRQGLKQWQKPLLTLIGAIPLMAVNAGTSIVRVPFIGAVNFGIFYPLVLIPLAVIFTSNAFNLLGGFDGIATGTGLIASLGLLLYSIFFGTYTGALVSGVLFAALLAFFAFNIYPARLIPGDSFTYAVGTALVASMIIGNMEAFGFVVFFPWFVEFFLHARKKFKVTDLGKRRSDGTFAAPYGKKIYSWTHAIMNIKPMKEWEVSLYMCGVEVAFVALAFIMKFLALL